MKLLSSSRFFGTRLVLMPALFALCLTAFTSQAHAGCGMITGVKAGPPVKMPPFPGGESESLFPNTSIVGLWHTTYTATDNSIFLESFKSWHADGLEFESAWLNPGGGNVCTGTWKFTDFRTVKLHHIGWIYLAPNETTAANYFTVDEVDTVAPHGKTYSGTFDFKIWNLDGTPLIDPKTNSQVETKGTIAATRITVN